MTISVQRFARYYPSSMYTGATAMVDLYCSSEGVWESLHSLVWLKSAKNAYATNTEEQLGIAYLMLSILVFEMAKVKAADCTMPSVKQFSWV